MKFLGLGNLTINTFIFQRMVLNLVLWCNEAYVENIWCLSYQYDIGWMRNAFFFCYNIIFLVSKFHTSLFQFWLLIHRSFLQATSVIVPIAVVCWFHVSNSCLQWNALQCTFWQEKKVEWDVRNWGLTNLKNSLYPPNSNFANIDLGSMFCDCFFESKNRSGEVSTRWKCLATFVHIFFASCIAQYLLKHHFGTDPSNSTHWEIQLKITGKSCLLETPRFFRFEFCRYP